MVEPRGLEAKSVSPEKVGTYADPSNPRGAKSGALSLDSAPDGPSDALGPPEPPARDGQGDTPPDADLAALLKVWRNLPPAARRALTDLAAGNTPNGGAA